MLVVQQLRQPSFQLPFQWLQWCLLLLQTPTIAQMDLQIGRRGGLWARRHGAVKFMEKDALQLQVVVRLLPPMIAMQDSPIGWWDGLWLRKRGVASMAARAALQRQADALRVLRLTGLGFSMKGCGAGAVRHLPVP